MIVNFMNFSNADTLKIKTNNFLDDSTNPVQKTDFFSLGNFPSNSSTSGWTAGELRAG